MFSAYLGNISILVRSRTEIMNVDKEIGKFDTVSRDTVNCFKSVGLRPFQLGWQNTLNLQLEKNWKKGLQNIETAVSWSKQTKTIWMEKLSWVHCTSTLAFLPTISTSISIYLAELRSIGIACSYIFFTVKFTLSKGLSPLEVGITVRGSLYG